MLDADEITAFLREVFPEAVEWFVIEEVDGRGARIRGLVSTTILRPGGTVSGPFMMSLADTVMWVAVLSRVGRNAMTATVNLNIDFLRRPAPVDQIATCELLRVGRRLAVGHVVIHSDGDPDPVAQASVTYAIPSGG